MKYFDTLGVMIDCSRNAVMTIPQLKKFIALLAKMGYNHVELYTEDTYEVDGEPFFGYFRGKYSQAELKELDDYAYGLGVELVPCIQTLAHLNAIFRWEKYKAMTDIDDILLVDDERTYQLIEAMISSLRKCFRTKKIHIGMDEAGRLGQGRYRELHGEQDRTNILLYHLNKVCEITDKYGFEPMMWSDMFYRLANGGEYYGLSTKFNADIRNKIPEKVTLVYWDYYHTDKKTYTAMIAGHKKLTDRVMLAGGAWKWGGFTPHNEFAIRTIKAGFNACIEGGLRDAVITLWGDNGAEASVYSVLPALCYAACLAQGITAPDEIKANFRKWVGYEYDDFMLLDLPDRSVPTKEVIDKVRYALLNPSKYQLYNDCFMGIFDTSIAPGESKKYATYGRKLQNAAKRTGEYSYLFRAAAAFCTLLSYKSNIGIRTREVYADITGIRTGVVKADTTGNNTNVAAAPAGFIDTSTDKAAALAELDKLIADYKKMIKLAEQFYLAFRNQWYLENKPHGFDVQDARLGGLIMRMKSCLDRLTAFRNSEITSIPELEEPVLPLHTKKTYHNHWDTNITTNIL